MMVTCFMATVLFVMAVGFAQDAETIIERLDGEWLTAAIIAVVYLVVMIFSRWNFTAVPKRNNIKAQVEAIHKRLTSEVVEAELGKIDAKLITETKQSIESLLKKSEEMLKPKPLSGLVWSQGEELAALRLLHEAKRQLARLLPIERVRQDSTGH